MTKTKVRELIQKFKENHKSINCRDLLTEDKPTIHKMHSDKCSSIVAEVCDLLDEEI